MYGALLPSSLVPPTPPGAPPPGIFPNIGPPALSAVSTFTPTNRLSYKPILSPHGIPVPTSGAIPPVQMRSVQHGCFQGQFSSCFVVQTPSSPHNGNYLPKCFFADFLPTMQGPYTPSLGHFGARPSYVMHLPVSKFSENCATLYEPPAQFGSSHAFYKPPIRQPVLKVQSTTACPAAPATYAPAASMQPPPAGSHFGAHAH